MYLVGLIDNGLNGIVWGIGESDCSLRCCSKDGRGIVLFIDDGLGWDVTTRCCKRGFRGCFIVGRRSANWGWTGLDSFVDGVIGNASFVRTSAVVLSASTASSKASIDNLTFESIIVEFSWTSLFSNEGGGGGGDWFLGDSDGVLK